MSMYDNFYMAESYKRDILFDVKFGLELQTQTYEKLKQSEVLLIEIMDKIDSHVELVDLRDKIGNFLK